MFSRDYDFASGCSNRDAIDGLSAIAAALDQGISAPTRSVSSKIADVIAIGLGWLVLAAVILYPTLQLAAIAACVGFMFLRSFPRLVFGSPRSSSAYDPGAFAR
jgi:hypothetical protein